MAYPSPDLLVRDFIKYVNEGDITHMNALISDDLEFTDISGNVYLEKEFMQEYLKNFPSYQIHIDHILIGAEGVAVIGRTSGSHVPPHIEQDEILVWTADVKDGLIVNWRIYASEGYAGA